jgi:hypothetical protein
MDGATWLEDFRSGKTRPKWMGKMADPCAKMLAGAGSAEERIAAALPLVALGQEEKALAALLRELDAQPAMVDRIAAVLPWLVWEKRLEVFGTLVERSAGKEHYSSIIMFMCRLPDGRAAEPVWGMLVRPEADVDLANVVLSSLRQVYLGDRYYDVSSLPAASRKAAVEAAKAKALEGKGLQRMVGMALLLNAAPDEAATTCGQVLADAQADAELRADALQMQLLAVSPSRGTSVAAKAMQDPALRRVAMVYLSNGLDRLTSLRGRIYLYYNNPELQRTRSGSGGQPIEVAAPKGVSADELRPMLKDSDEGAALAAYMLATMKDRQGLEVLLAYWRAHGREDEMWRALVYRAISASNDDSLVPVLEEIYRSMDKSDYRMREFYWTIRSMDGPNILKLRKQIRQDVGMDRLR